jgi:predicted outer membrane repeat protein
MRKPAFFTILSGGIVLFVGMAAAVERHVPSDYLTIQAGINASSSGDTVLVADGVYEENIIFPPGKDIIVKSENGPEATTIDGDRTGSVVTFDNGVWADWVLEGFTVVNGYAPEGGGIHCSDSSPTLINCIISDNSAYQGDGGGIYIVTTSGREPLGSTIRPCAGGVPSGCGYTSAMTMQDCSVLGNSAAVNGGGVSSINSSLIVIGGAFSSNTASALGGGICFEGSDSDFGVSFTTRLRYIEVSGNSASNGGGLAVVEHSQENVSSQGPDLNPQIVEDSGGTLHVVWESGGDFNGTGWTDPDIFHSTKSGAAWSLPVVVSHDNAYEDWNPQIIEDSNTLYAVWASMSGSGTDYDIFCATNSGSGWSFPELVNTNGTTDSGNDFNPQIIKDSSGKLHAVWHSVGGTGPNGSDYDVFYASNNGSGWSYPTLLNTNGNSDMAVDAYPQIIKDSSGKLYAVWHSNAGGDGDYDIFYATNSGSGWSAPSLLNINGTTDEGVDAYPQIIEDSSGKLHAVWHSDENLFNVAGYDYDIFYATNSGSGWSYPCLLNTNGTTDTGNDWDPQIIEDSGGTLYAVWESEEDLYTDYDIFCATNSGSGWSSPSLVNNNGTTDLGDDYLPQIIEDSSGGIFHVVWESDENLNFAGTDYDIFYTYGSCGDWCAPILLNPSRSSFIQNAIFIGNHASNNGGAIYARDSNTPMSNCIISGNDANGCGGGIYCSNSSPTLMNFTITDNDAPAGGGLYDHNNSNPTLTNCILWANVREQINYDGRESLPVVNYCDVNDGWPGTGNINLDPLFANSQSGDYHLRSANGRWDSNRQQWVTDASTSPCIDAGDPNSDWKAELWPHGKRINMGAYGGTPQASMSLSTVGNIANLDNDPCDIIDFNDLALFVEKWLYEEVLLPEDLDRNGIVNFVDYAIFAQQWLGALAAEPGIEYEISPCEEMGMSGAGQLDETRFTVTVEGSHIHFEDMMVANCCPGELWVEMDVTGNLITINEHEEHGEYPCPCMCDYPVTATLGPFEPGTYTLSVYEDYGGFIGSTTVNIE